MNLVAYQRVSTDKQADEGMGLEIQEAAIAKWAKANGHVIVAVHQEEGGLTGTKDLDDRPALSSALAAIVDGVATGVVVYKLDRLARYLTVQETVLAQVWRYGGSVFSVDVGEVLQDDPDDPMRTFVRQVMGAAAQLERGMIAARMRAGRKHKQGKGGYAGFGSPAFGQRAEERELAPDIDEQATIARMAELAGAGKGLQEIANTLNAEGRTSKRGGNWHKETVRRVLARLGQKVEQAA